MLRITRPNAKVISVECSPEVPPVLWSKVRSEWGTDGPDPNSVILTPIEVFLANLDWLFEACQIYNTGIHWDEAAKSLVIRTRNEQNSVVQILSGVSPLDEAAVLGRLAGGRFSRELRAFQKRDLGWLLALPNGANFSVPGAGKTTVTYALYEAERLVGKVKHLLVIAPLSAFDSWKTEAVDCFSQPPVVHFFDGSPIPDHTEVCLITYQRLPISYDTVAEWVQSEPCQVVLDEAHRMKKGWVGSWGSHCLYLARLATRRDVLTGTPAPQSVRDVEALIDFVWPNQARRILPNAVFERQPSHNAAAQVGSSIAPLFVRTTKTDLNLPEPVMKVLEVPLEEHQRDIYHALKNQYAGDILVSRTDRAQFARLGRIVMYLLEAATNPALLPIGGTPDPLTSQPQFPMMDLPPNASLAELIANYPRHELPPKFKVLAKLVDENATAGRKTLVWTNFVANILMLEQTFASLKPALIYGGIPSELTRPNTDRTREAELFRFRYDDDCLVLLANPAATSEGVSLHKQCHDAIYLDRTFNAGHYLQSIDRIHRLGMPDVETRITFLVTKETIDITVNSRVKEKAEQLGIILSDRDIVTMALPDDENYEDVIDTGADIEALYAHLRGEDMTSSSASGH